jgi:PAS domain S-box-containing protein
MRQIELPKKIKESILALLKNNFRVFRCSYIINSMNLEYERLKSEIERLKKENLQIRTTFNAISNPLFIKDQNLIYTDCNDAFASFLGIPKEKIINSSVFDLSPEPLAKIYDKADRQLMESRKNQIYESQVQFADKTLHDVIFNKALIFSENNKIAGIVGIISDITNLREVERKLEESNATKDKFYSIIAHDLKNPFHGIIGFSNLIINNYDKNKYDEDKYDEDKYEKIYNYVRLINETAHQAYVLLENLLNWSRSQTNIIEFKPTKINLEYLIVDILDIISGNSQAKNIKVSYEISENLNILADRNMLSTILQNIVTNAIKFTRESGFIRIVATRIPNNVLISVIDNGVGIEPEKIDKLFKIHERMSTQGTNNEKGTGLGLMLCKEFIEKHGGKIWVESEAGRGSTFKFTIPYK